MSFLDLLRLPDFVSAQTDEAFVPLQIHQAELWQAQDIEVATRVAEGRLDITVQAPATPLQRLHLRWQTPITPGLRLLGDAWERGYGDLEWRGLVPERIMPWYFLAYDGQATHGYGVETGPSALCFWRVDSAGASLWLDLRCGARPVELGERVLHAATILTREGRAGESPFQAAQAFCRQLCPSPRLPNHPVYGSNNWYYAYGRSSHGEVLEDARILTDNAPNGENRPYMTIDAGWQPRSHPADPACGGPWDGGNAQFPDMPGLAAGIRDLGARPGIWLRPLAAPPDAPASWLLPVERARDSSAKIPVLDPSRPDVLAQIQADFRRLNQWGYALIKHDWTTCDILGRWGFDMGSELTNGGWRFADSSKTTAEVILNLFRAIRAGAGDSLVIGCNTVGHLAAGLFELQRTGDDTSGQEWERTRKMGVNTLAFRMGQQNAFYAVDADCVGLTRQVPWELNKQWLDLLARSGTPLFVSAAPDALGPQQVAALRAAFARAAQAQPVGEPLDWLETTCPAAWNLGGERVTYDWFGAEGMMLP